MNLAKLLALGVGGYLLYNWFSNQPAAGAAPAPAGAKPNGTAIREEAPTLRSVLLDFAHANGYADPVLLNMHEWCAFYAALAGRSPCPDPTQMFPGIAQDLRMPVDQFVAGATSYGLKGLRGLGKFDAWWEHRARWGTYGW